jgi:hypothetical protein
MESGEEMVLMQAHQAGIQALAGADIFNRVGVPGAGMPTADGGQAFLNGGMAQRWMSEPLVLNIDVSVGMSQSGAEEIAIRGMSGNNGQQVIINQLNSARLNRRI